MAIDAQGFLQEGRIPPWTGGCTYIGMVSAGFLAPTLYWVWILCAVWSRRPCCMAQSPPAALKQGLYFPALCLALDARLEDCWTPY